MFTIEHKYLSTDKPSHNLFLLRPYLQRLYTSLILLSLIFFTSACTTAFEPEPPCGNGTLDQGEACDDNNRINGDGCSDKCEIEPGWLCLGEGCSPICGDGIKTSKEECDDGAHNDPQTDKKDGCSNDCKVESGWSCKPSDPENPTSQSICVRVKYATQNGDD